jgi:hypothetical protein
MPENYGIIIAVQERNKIGNHGNMKQVTRNKEWKVYLTDIGIMRT